MADKKISQLTGASTPLDGTEVLPIVQSGATVKVANNDLRPKQIQSNATSGVLQVVGPAAASTRVMTTPDANFTVARTDAAQTFTGTQTFGAVTATGNVGIGTGVSASGFNTTLAINRTGGGTRGILFQDGGSDQSGLYTDSGSTGPLYIFSNGTRPISVSVNSAESANFDTSNNVKITAGNLIVGTAGKGVDFSANTHAAGMTSELLNDYEEGTFTPSVGGNATYTSRSGNYTKIGRQVTVNFSVQINVIGTGSTSQVITNLPFTVGAKDGCGSIRYFGNLSTNVVSLNCYAAATTSVVYLTSVTSAAATTSAAQATVMQDGTYIIGSVTYFV